MEKLSFVKGLFLGQDVEHRLVLTLILFVLCVLLRYSMRRMVLKWNVRNQDMRRKWSLMVRRVSTLLFFVGLVLIWASSIRSAALTLAALALAIVSATRELIMCFMGSVMKSSSRSFHVGDRIVVGTLAGDVVDQTLLSTTLLEVGPGGSVHQYTGRVVTIPNSMFLTTPVKNETFGEKYSVHSFKIAVPREQNWKMAGELLLDVCRIVTRPYLDDARKNLEIHTVYNNYNYINVEPRVSYDFGYYRCVDLVVRIPCLTNERASIEQRIIQMYIERFEVQAHSLA